jgi:hypothetical protein
MELLEAENQYKYLMIREIGKPAMEFLTGLAMAIFCIQWLLSA